MNIKAGNEDLTHVTEPDLVPIKERGIVHYFPARLNEPIEDT